MTAQQLLLDLVNAGLKIRQYDGWETRGDTWRRGKPVGVMHHHTAAPVPYPVPRLAGSLLKANMNTKPNGEVWLIAYRACNFSSGSGSSVVLKEVLAGTPPTHNAKTRGLDDDTNGNPYFWNFENDHLGHGEPMPAVQHRAIVVATQVVNHHFGLTANNTISHAEWTYRKQDPYWNGDRRAIETIRQQVAEVGDIMTPEQEAKLDQILAALGPVKSWKDWSGNSRRSTRAIIDGWWAMFAGKPLVWHLIDAASIDVDSLASDADLDQLAADLREVLPDDVLNRLVQRLAPGPA